MKTRLLPFGFELTYEEVSPSGLEVSEVVCFLESENPWYDIPALERGWGVER